MIYDDNAKPWIDLIDFLAKHDEDKLIQVRVFVEGVLEDGTEVFVKLPDTIMNPLLESIASRLSIPSV